MTVKLCLKYYYAFHFNLFISFLNVCLRTKLILISKFFFILKFA